MFQLKINPSKVCNFALKNKRLELHVTVWQNDHDILRDISKYYLYTNIKREREREKKKRFIFLSYLVN